MSRTLTGTVVSNKGDKTIVISIQTRKTNRIYKKQYSVTTKFMAHDEKNEANVGDLVTIVETRPLSARKRFALSAIVERAAISEKDRVENVTADKEEEK
ncbi:MAG: 30S ribosomal protein S17 [bacterium]